LEKLLNFEDLSLAPGSTAKTATGNANDNLIKGNDFPNTLNGLDGNDILDGSGGLDSLIGGKGNDTYRLANDGDVITEKPGEGIDTIEIQDTFSLLLPSLKNNVENLTLSGTIAVDGTGTNADNVLTGNSAANTLTGLDGNDRLYGDQGTDIFIGGRGTDTLDLTESLASKDVVTIAAGDSLTGVLAGVSEADKVIKFAAATDVLDLPSLKIAANVATDNGQSLSIIKSHNISNGIIKFDDADTYAAPLAISLTTNMVSVIDYLKANITGNETVAFQAGVDVWVFQDGGANDTLVELVGGVGAAATSLSIGSFSTSAIHLA
jgi:Ca2+-binding RTX toxin-like protein